MATLSDIAADRIRRARKARGWRPADLAARCAEAGHPELTENVIENIEGGRRDGDGNRTRQVTVDELGALSLVLGFAAAEAIEQAPATDLASDVIRFAETYLSVDLTPWQRDLIKRIDWREGKPLAADPRTERRRDGES